MLFEFSITVPAGRGNEVVASCYAIEDGSMTFFWDNDKTLPVYSIAKDQWRDVAITGMRKFIPFTEHISYGRAGIE